VRPFTQVAAYVRLRTDLHHEARHCGYQSAALQWLLREEIHESTLPTSQGRLLYALLCIIAVIVIVLLVTGRITL
jgi:hypothetical protein